jgi:hypothetical protein
LNNAPINLKRSRHYSKRRELKERVREHATPLRTTIVGHMVKRWQKITHTRAVTIPRTDTSVRSLRITTWEEVNPTRNYV